MFKTLPYRDGGLEEFSNVYRYSINTVGTEFPQDRALGVIEALRTIERNVHGPAVNLVRCESSEVNILDGIKPTDMVVEFNQPMAGLAPAIPAGEEIPPEIIVMCQERVGTKRWLRKYLHTLSLGFEANADGVAFSFDLVAGGWNAVTGYAGNLGHLPYNEPDGSPATAILEAGNGAASDDAFIADPQIRWHDLKY